MNSLRDGISPTQFTPKLVLARDVEANLLSVSILTKSSLTVDETVGIFAVLLGSSRGGKPCSHNTIFLDPGRALHRLPLNLSRLCLSLSAHKRARKAGVVKWRTMKEQLGRISRTLLASSGSVKRDCQKIVIMHCSKFSLYFCTCAGSTPETMRTASFVSISQ